MVLPGKCSSSKVLAVSVELVVKEPSGFLMKLVVVLVNLFCTILESRAAFFWSSVPETKAFQLSLLAVRMAL